MNWNETALRLLGAFAAGVLIDIERGWTLRDLESGTRVAGVRTFALLSLTGGVAGIAATSGALVAGGAIVLATMVILVLGYSRSLRERGSPCRG